MSERARSWRWEAPPASPGRRRASRERGPFAAVFHPFAGPGRELSWIGDAENGEGR